MVNVQVDGKPYQLDEKKNLIDALKDVNIEIPHFCYHPKLSVVGMCRICLIEIEGVPRVQPACNTAVTENLKIKVASEKAINARAGVMEFQLINHPLDCPVCDKAGECRLQNYSFSVGGATTHFDEPKRTTPQEELGTNLLINHNRCILCYRCVRFDSEIVGVSDLEFKDRGGDTIIAYTPPTAESSTLLDHNYQGSLADICPVGALLNKNTLFSSRVWFYEEKSTICHGCSTLCNVSSNVKNNEIYRYMPPTNPEQDGYFICDYGRFSASEFSKDRLYKYTIHGKSSVSKDVFSLLKTKISNNSRVLWVGGSTESNEEIQNIQNISHKVSSKVSWDYRTEEYMWNNEWNKQVDFLLSVDKRPNGRFLRDNNLAATFKNKAEWLEAVKNTDFIFIFNEFSSPYTYLSSDKDMLRNNALYQTIEQNNLWNKVVLFTTHENEATNKAFISIPILSFVEKNYHFTDKNGLVKSSQPSITPPQGLLNIPDNLSKIWF